MANEGPQSPWLGALPAGTTPLPGGASTGKPPRPPNSAIDYPESDGEPMADNTKQLAWIVVLYGNLAALFRDKEDVFVGGNQNWFPREGEPELFKAPDVYAVFG